jgi:hypothetical protein
MKLYPSRVPSNERHWNRLANSSSRTETTLPIYRRADDQSEKKTWTNSLYRSWILIAASLFDLFALFSLSEEEHVDRP